MEGVCCSDPSYDSMSLEDAKDKRKWHTTLIGDYCKDPAAAAEALVCPQFLFCYVASTFFPSGKDSLGGSCAIVGVRLFLMTAMFTPLGSAAMFCSQFMDINPSCCEGPQCLAGSLCFAPICYSCWLSRYVREAQLRGRWEGSFFTDPSPAQNLALDIPMLKWTMVAKKLFSIRRLGSEKSKMREGFEVFAVLARVYEYMKVDAEQVAVKRREIHSITDRSNCAVSLNHLVRLNLVEME